METALLDLDILMALLWPAHEHHGAAHHWFRARGGARWASWALMQLGLVRIVSNPAFSREALSPPDAVALLGQNLSHSAHEFWKESLQLPAAVRGTEDCLQGYRQLTDMYLLVLSTGSPRSGR